MSLFNSGIVTMSDASSPSTDDWLLLCAILSLLSALVIMGPARHLFAKGIISMFRFNDKTHDLVCPFYAPAIYLLLSIVSCINFGIAFTLLSWELTGVESPFLTPFLINTGIVALFLLVKMLLFQTVNSRLYRRQVAAVKPVRWNSFYIMVFSTASLLVQIFSLTVFLLELPLICILFWTLLILIFAQIGLFYKLKTALFKKSSSTLGFILYLCALQILPIILMLALLGISVS